MYKRKINPDMKFKSSSIYENLKKNILKKKKV